MSWLKVGIVGRARGLRGAFYVSGRDEPFLAEYKNIIIGKTAENGKPTAVVTLSLISGRSCIKCDISKSKTDAEQLTGLPIWVEESFVTVDDETEYLWSDIEGRKVFAGDDLIGKVRAVYCSGASDIVIIDDETRSVELPLIPAYFDMSFTTGEETLQLIMDTEAFEDLWIDRRGKGK